MVGIANLPLFEIDVLTTPGYVSPASLSPPPLRWARAMPFPRLSNRRSAVSHVLVWMTLFGFLPHLAGCGSTRGANRKSVPEFPAAAVVLKQGPQGAQKEIESTSTARPGKAKRSRAKNALRDGAYAIEEGTKKVAR